MIDISKYVNEASDCVDDALDKLYMKQLMIIENTTDLNIDEYKCFQEGFLLPRSKVLKLYKFDNKHLLNAIKYFNKALEEVPFDEYYPEFDNIKNSRDRGKLTERYMIELPREIKRFIEDHFNVKNGHFMKGLKEFEKQFDCKYATKIRLNSGGTGTKPIFLKFPENSDKRVTVSKTKGFQLGGVTIHVDIDISEILEFTPANRNLFGQVLSSILLHETFHNIIQMVNVKNKQLTKDVDKTIKETAESKNQITITTKLSSFVERFKKLFNINKGEIDEDKLMKRMYVLSQIKDDKKAVKKFTNDVNNNNDKTDDKEIEEYIQALKKLSKETKRQNIGSGTFFSAVISILYSVLSFAMGSVVHGCIGLACIAVLMMNKIGDAKSILGGLGKGIQEEYFCDLFAAMYQLPAHFVSYNRLIALNKSHPDKVTKVDALEDDIHKSLGDEHPNTFDRELTSYKLAKQILASNKRISKEIKEYLEYIVDLHEGIEDIKTKDSKRRQKRLSPEAAKDLQETMKEFVNKTGVTVTESYIDELCNITGGVYYGIG